METANIGKIVDRIMAQVPAWRGAKDIEVQPQKGGLTNASYLITVDGERFILRVSGENTDSLGTDRLLERDVWLAACSIGIAPEVIAFILPQGHLITSFIDGHEWSVEEFKQPAVMKRVAAAMRRVHALPPVGGAFSPYRDIEHRLEVASVRNLDLPEKLDAFLDRVREIEASRESTMPRDRVLCHNDPFPNNFLDDGSVRLLDWEFGGMGDRFYDLACVCAYFSPEQKREFLTYYFGEVTPEAEQTLETLGFVVSFWNATWAMLQIGMPYADHDYTAMADRIFTTMEGRL